MASQAVQEHAIEEVEYGNFAEDDDAFFGFDLKNVVALVRRNLVWIALIVGLALVAGLVMTLLTVPQYIATSKVLVEIESEQIIEGADLTPSTNSWDIDRFLETQLDILRSRTLAERVVVSGKFDQDDNFFNAMGAKLPAPEDLTAEYSGPDGMKKYRKEMAIYLVNSNIKADLPGNSRVISINFSSNSPNYAAKVANAYAQNFIDNNLNRKFETSAYARKFLSDQLEEARARLETSEKDLNQFSRAAGLIRVSGQTASGSGESTLSVTNDALVQLNNSASLATAQRVSAEDQWKTISNEPVLSVPEVLANPAIQTLIRQKAELQGQLAVEKSRHLDGYPTVQSLQAQIAELDARINSIGNSIKRSVYLEFESAKEKEGSLADQVQELRSSALSEQDRGVQYTVLKRVADTNRSLYDTLLERYNQLNATAGAASNNISLVDSAEVPDSPSSPKLVLNLLMALLIGMVLAGAFVVIRDYYDDTIRSPEDVERKLGLPLLGLIPVSEDIDPDAADPKSTISEAYHSLVTSLTYSTSGGLPRTLAVTSAREGEGKTTSAHSVALDLARMGKSVLLIDADMRRPTLHRRIENSGHRGLSDILTGQATMDEVLQPSGQDGLTYVTALPIPPQPSILLGGDRFKQVLAEARSRFEVVVLDCPPMLGLSDTASIASNVDGVVIMIDASEFHRGVVKSALRRLALVNARVLGVVITKFDPKSSGGNYSYYGYNYYQYGNDRSA